MSQIQVDSIFNKDGDGAPSFPKGTVVTGVVTATSFSGSGANLTDVTATDVGTLSSLNVTGNVSIGGTLTYEDVTNVDSVGIITARDDINIVTDNKKLNIGAGADLQISHTNNLSTIYNSHANGVAVRSNVILLQNSTGNHDYLTTANELGVSLFFDNVKKIETTSGGVKVSGNYTENIVAVSGTAIDCSQGSYFTKTITGATTFTFTNVPTGVAYAFTFEVTLNGSNAITWPGSVKWPADTAPTITDGKTQVFVFLTDDGGTRWRGSSLVDYTN